MSGPVRLAQWLVDPRFADRPAHAFPVGDKIPFRSHCGLAHWSVRTRNAAAGPLCPDCRDIVATAAFCELEEISALEAAEVPA